MGIAKVGNDNLGNLVWSEDRRMLLDFFVCRNNCVDGSPKRRQAGKQSYQIGISECAGDRSAAIEDISRGGNDDSL